MRMTGFDLVNDDCGTDNRKVISKMMIEEIQTMKALQKPESPMFFAFTIKTGRLKGRLARLTEEGISLLRVINIKAIRKLAYLTLPNRT